MACFHPLSAWHYPVLPGQKKVVKFSQNAPLNAVPLQLPCGQCIGCRLLRSQHWALRCLHELKYHKSSCFLTLTYDDAHLPSDGSLRYRDFQLFMKRLRKHFGSDIRFFMCGEYGEKLHRPHYHVILFGLDFTDKVFYKYKNGLGSVGVVKYFNSPTLSKLWSHGYAVIGSVTYHSVAYVARYVLKKVNSKKNPEHYKGLVPEFTNMSRRPGIGNLFFNDFSDDIYSQDFCLSPTLQKIKPPRYYDNLLELLDFDLFCDVKERRVQKASALSKDGLIDPLRNLSREKIVSQRVKKLVRSYELALDN